MSSKVRVISHMVKDIGFYEFNINDFIVLFDINKEYDTFEVWMSTNFYVLKRTKFRLINHHTNDMIKDICTQIIQRISCHNYMDESKIFYAFEFYPEDYGLTMEYVKTMDKISSDLINWDIMPWLYDDYNHILDQLHELGYNVIRLDDYIHRTDNNEKINKSSTIVCNDQNGISSYLL